MLRVLKELIYLLLRQKLDSLTMCGNNENSWINEIPREWIFANADMLDVSLSFIWPDMTMLLRVLGVLFKWSILAFFDSILVIDFIVKRSFEISNCNMHFLSFMRKMAIIDTWSVDSLGLIHLFQVVSVHAESGSFILFINSRSCISRDYSKVSVCIDDHS
jgi:hypothetical protein